MDDDEKGKAIGNPVGNKSPANNHFIVYLINI